MGTAAVGNAPNAEKARGPQQRPDERCGLRGAARRCSCNHPKLIYDAVHSKDKADKLSTKGGGAASKKSAVAGFEVRFWGGARCWCLCVNLPAPPRPHVAIGLVRCRLAAQGVAHLFPPCLFDDGRPGRGAMAVGWEDTSGKFGVAARMLAVLWHETDDK